MLPPDAPGRNRDLIVMPFGKHKGQPLPRVPTSYLQWLLRECQLSSGLRAAVAAEVSQRGREVPPPPPPRPVRRCRDHPDAEPLLSWLEDSLGRRRIRADCPVCRRPTDYPPCVPPYTTEADRRASPTAVLDVLIRLDTLGIDLESDGRGVSVGWQDYHRVPADLHRLIRQCKNHLARLLGDTRPRRRADVSPTREPCESTL
jgi:hypothetical protein